MAIFVSNCPHCRAEEIALQVVNGTTRKGDAEELLIVATHFMCPRCQKPSCALMIPGKQRVLPPDNWSQTNNDLGNMGWLVLEFWPAPPAPNVPESLPDDVTRIYLQAERNFPIIGNEDAAGTMFRKALDVGLKKIDPETKGVLAVRIKKLATANKLTPAIAEWADHVRDLGNDAAHEAEPPTRAELTDLRNFTEMVMRYLFSLPALVEKRRAEADEI